MSVFTNDFIKNSDLVDSVKKVMEENELRRQVEISLNESLGIQNRKQLPHEDVAAYDEALAEATTKSLAAGKVALDEVSKEKLYKYIGDSSVDKMIRGIKNSGEKKIENRTQGAITAKKKLYGGAKVPAVNEDEQIEEMSRTKVGKYLSAASDNLGKTSMDRAERMTKKTKTADDTSAIASDRKTEDKREVGIRTAVRKIIGKAKVNALKEEQINEISKKVLGSYIKKASADAANRSASSQIQREFGNKEKSDAQTKKAASRLNGVTKATDKLVKEGSDDKYDVRQHKVGNKVIPGGQGIDDDHDKNPFHGLVTQYGYKYSHSTPIHRADGSTYIHHTYEKGEHKVGISPSGWDTTTSTGSGRKQKGTSSAELEKHLKNKKKRYTELKEGVEVTTQSVQEELEKALGEGFLDTLVNGVKSVGSALGSPIKAAASAINPSNFNDSPKPDISATSAANPLTGVAPPPVASVQPKPPVPAPLPAQKPVQNIAGTQASVAVNNKPNTPTDTSSVNRPKPVAKPAPKPTPTQAPLNTNPAPFSPDAYRLMAANKRAAGINEETKSETLEQYLRNRQ